MRLYKDDKEKYLALQVKEEVDHPGQNTSYACHRVRHYVKYEQLCLIIDLIHPD